MGRYLNTLKNAEKGEVTTLTNLNNSDQYRSFGLLGSPSQCTDNSAPTIAEDKPACDVVSYRWLMHFVERDPMIVTFSPEVNNAEALARYPDAVAAEPITEEAKHLSSVCCRIDVDVMTPFDTDLDDRRCCFQCTNLTVYGCLAARRGDIAASLSYSPARELLRRCEGYLPKMSDSDHRPGRERWPGINEPLGGHANNQSWALSPFYETDDFTTA